MVRPTEDKDSYDPHGPKNPDDRVPVKDPDHLTDGEKNDVKDEIGKENPDLPKGTEVDVDDKGNATIKYPDGSKDTIPGDQLVQGQKGDTTDAGKITPSVKWLVFATGSLVDGTFGVVFSASVAGRTKSLPLIVSVE